MAEEQKHHQPDPENTQALPKAQQAKHPHWRKKSVCVLYAFDGRKYRGNVANLRNLPRHETVDGLLEQAMYHAGCILPSNYGRLDGAQKWKHSSRTDKGVSSTFTWVHCRILVDPEALASDPMGTSMVHEINAHLPSLCGIKVFAICRVPKSFNPRSACISRMYEYLLPARVLAHPLHDSIQRLRTALSYFEGFYPFHNYTKRALYRPPADAVIGSKRAKPESKEEEEENEHFEGQADDDSPSSADAGDSSQYASQPANEQQSTAESSEQKHLWFASWKEQPDPDDLVGKSHFRRVLSFRCGMPRRAFGSRSEPVDSMDELVSTSASDSQSREEQGELYIPINVHGTSFMLHQIRRMVGTAVAAANGNIELDALEASLSRPARMLTPRAPAQSLLLTGAEFRKFQVRPQKEEGQTYEPPDKLYITEDVQEQLRGFKEQVIVPGMLPVLSDPHWDDWAKSLTKFASDTAISQRQELMQKYAEFRKDKPEHVQRKEEEERQKRQERADTRNLQGVPSV